MKYSIKDKNVLRIKDKTTDAIYYGSNQEWFSKWWQRMSGCGPSAVTNIIYYRNQTRNGLAGGSNLTKAECVNLMDEIWGFVTPSIGGISSTGMLCRGVNRYRKEKNLELELDSLDVLKKKEGRPELQQVISFLVTALEKDSPVAFLNLEHGTVYEVDSWHWVTIISIEYESGEDVAFVDILDGGRVKRIDLSRWLQTTKLGGGFVSFG